MFIPEVKITPDVVNRTYFPATTDIQNRVYTAQMSLELSKFDQDNFKLKINEWKKVTHSSNFHFRSHTDDNKEENLLYMHREKWQIELLARYGSSVVLMDATYKTTKCGIPLFFITAKTNVGYSIVADFVVQAETIKLISEALQILQNWNPDWKPPCFMTDYSDAEIEPIESTFPNFV